MMNKETAKELVRDPLLVLRLGLAGVFIYAGIDILVYPELWIGFVPQWISSFLPAGDFLVGHAIIELILGFGFLVGFRLPIVSIIAFFDMLGILVFYGVDEITFRDFGLALAALSLFLSSLKQKRRPQEL